MDVIELIIVILLVIWALYLLIKLPRAIMRSIYLWLKYRRIRKRGESPRIMSGEEYIEWMEKRDEAE